MKSELTHEEAFAALDAAALDVLDIAERDAVLWHAAGCAICTAELVSLRDAAAMIALSSPLAADTATRSRARIRLKLIARASDERAPDQRQTSVAPTSATPARPSTPPTARTPVVHNLPKHEQSSSGVPQVLFPAAKKDHPTAESRIAWLKPEWIAVAATILAVASMAGLAMTMRDRDTIEGLLREQTAASAQARTMSDSLRTAVMQRDSLIAGMTGKNVAMMTLTASGTRQPMGRMFWDQAHNMWTLVAHDMPALKAGRTYQLWLMTAKTKINAGTFTASAGGDAMMRAMYPLTPADLRAVAVTEEPAGGMPQPTGSMIMVAQAH
jgi:hypothetical protein